MTQTSNRLASSKAFTIVELMVVVAILAVLVAFLLPVLSKVRYSARLVACESNLRQIAAASIAFTIDWDGNYPNTDTPNYAYRGRVVDPAPLGLAKYCNGSVDWKKNRLWACPEAEMRSMDFNYKPTMFYALYYNSISSLYSGIDASQSYSGQGYIPAKQSEVMRRLGRPMTFKQRGFSGEKVKGWQSHVIASDVSHEAQGGYVEVGHMRGGSFQLGGYSPLRTRSRDATCTANFAMDDGSVHSATYNGKNYTTVMATAAGGPFDWDSYILPRELLKPYP